MRNLTAVLLPTRARHGARLHITRAREKARIWGETKAFSNKHGKNKTTERLEQATPVGGDAGHASTLPQEKAETDRPTPTRLPSSWRKRPRANLYVIQ